MRARESGDKRPCELCKTKTMFQFDVRGRRGGHIRYADVCWRCGEQPALTGPLADKPKAAA